MRISLAEIMNRREGVTELSVPLEFSVFERNGVAYEVLRKSEVRVALSSPAAKRVCIRLEAQVVLSAPCDRCLEEVELPFDIRYSREIDFSKTGEERAEELDELYYISGFDLDVDQLIFEELLVDFPAKILCREDCKGICRVCGANLNDGECGCDRATPDPRMAAIRDIFNNFKEV
ncbi:MAG: DUF177 domain-containing protein [Lachnospiraceae bacterium]|nr:DUF177 domain-containing protein [Lachnospiraceae bacterium]